MKPLTLSGSATAYGGCVSHFAFFLSFFSFIIINAVRDFGYRMCRSFFLFIYLFSLSSMFFFVTLVITVTRFVVVIAIIVIGDVVIVIILSLLL